MFEEVLEVAAMNGLQERVTSAESRSQRGQCTTPRARIAVRRGSGLFFAVLVLGAGVLFTEMRNAGANSGLASQQVYVVKPGDTLWSIAGRFAGNGNVSALEYRLYSEVGSTNIQPGQEIRIP
ncbi:MAG: LysM domain-containing protein [Nitrospiraceae bacterium]|nr:LysM domain-containing protein [Nitrospiraceae bacterium]